MTNYNEDFAPHRPAESRPGPYLARVVSHLDTTYMGVLEVEILRPVGNTQEEGQLHQVKYMSPFYGATDSSFLGKDPDDYNNTQKSYGFWMIPPDVGTTVIIIFIDGDPKRGYWIGCVPDENMNFMLPGLAATGQVIDSEKRSPTAEYNKVVNDSNADPNSFKKPIHPLAAVLESQGLLEDDIRGITTSSARRETPSMVFGISTPGPVDKQPGAKQGPIGKAEHQIPNAYVSHLGGTTFVMDDGDDKFLRKTNASEGPPDYSAVEQGETDGDVTIPHNELFRIRTRTGHQILLHNSEDLIYISNSRGTAWIELSSDGKIDIYAKDSISVRTENDFNFYANRDFNIEVGRNFNLKVAERHQTEVGSNKISIVNGNVVLQVDGNRDETVSGTTTLSTGSGHTITAGGDFEVKAANTNIDGGNIHLNSDNFGGTAADTPEPLNTFENPTEVEGETVESIMLRVPTTEPYPHHENLDPVNFKTEMTDRETGSVINVPDYWKKYSTITDTFLKIKG
jgi:hypothetical protein